MSKTIQNPSRHANKHANSLSLDQRISNFIIGLLEGIITLIAWGGYPFVRFFFGEQAFGMLSILVFGYFTYSFFGGMSSFVILYMSLAIIHGTYIIARRYFFDHPWYSFSYGVSIPYMIWQQIDKRTGISKRFEELISPYIWLHGFFQKITMEKVCYTLLDPLFFLLLMSLFFDLNFDYVIRYFFYIIALCIFLKELIIDKHERITVLDKRDLEIRMNYEKGLTGQTEGIIQTEGLRNSTRKAISVASRSPQSVSSNLLTTNPQPIVESGNGEVGQVENKVIELQRNQKL